MVEGGGHGVTVRRGLAGGAEGMVRGAGIWSVVVKWRAMMCMWWMLVMIVWMSAAVKVYSCGCLLGKSVRGLKRMCARPSMWQEGYAVSGDGSRVFFADGSYVYVFRGEGVLVVLDSLVGLLD